MKRRRTLSEMAEAANGPPLQIAGQPAVRCPYCGCGMLVDGTRRIVAKIERYVECRNANCGRRFLTRQPPPVFVKEIGGNDG